MARRKDHRWGKDAGADLVQIGKMTAKGLGRIGSFVKEQSVKRRLPKELQKLVAVIKGFRPSKKYRRELPTRWS